MNNNKPHYTYVENRPISCQFCGANVQGRIDQKTDPRTKEVVKECRWICARCGQLSKIGTIR